MGKKERDKGARGEREACKVLSEFGLVAIRTAPMQTGYSDRFGDIVILDENGDPTPFLRIEVKRTEKPAPDAALTECLSHRQPESLVMWRRNGQQWRVALTLSDLFMLLRAQEYEAWRNDESSRAD